MCIRDRRHCLIVSSGDESDNTIRKTPTRPSLRTVISQLCRSPDQLSLFFTDYFPRLAQECGGGMSFTERVSLLLQRHDEIEVWQKLSKVPGFVNHAHLIVWE